jgi:hypothetical protein
MTGQAEKVAYYRTQKIGTTRTGQPEHGSQNGTARRDTLNRTGITRPAKGIRRNGTDRIKQAETRLVDRQAERGNQNMTGRTGLPELI